MAADSVQTHLPSCMLLLEQPTVQHQLGRSPDGLQAGDTDALANTHADSPSGLAAKCLELYPLVCVVSEHQLHTVD